MQFVFNATVNIFIKITRSRFFFICCVIFYLFNGICLGFTFDMKVYGLNCFINILRETKFLF